MADQEREAQNRGDRKWLDKFEADMKKLRNNREKVPCSPRRGIGRRQKNGD